MMVVGRPMYVTCMLNYIPCRGIRSCLITSYGGRVSRFCRMCMVLGNLYHNNILYDYVHVYMCCV